MHDDTILAELQRVAGEHLAALVQQAYEAGKKAGEAEARAKVMMAFGASQVDSIPVLRPKLRAASSSSSKVSGPLRRVIAAMDIGDAGVQVRDVSKFAQRMPDIPPLTEQQVRAGLKALVKSRDLAMAARGRFRRGDRPIERDRESSEQSDSEPPHDGELFDAKSNGEARQWTE